MGKVKINKRMMYVLLTELFLVTTSLVGCSQDNKDKEIQINSVGSEVLSLFNFNLDEEDFIVLDIGDHD